MMRHSTLIKTIFFICWLSAYVIQPAWAEDFVNTTAVTVRQNLAVEKNITGVKDRMVKDHQGNEKKEKNETNETNEVDVIGETDRSRATQAEDITLRWERAPLTIVLPVGQERMVSFPMPFKVGLNHEFLTEDTLQIENNYKTLYLLAKKPFSNQRVQVNLENGLVVLINLRAEMQAPDNPIDVILSDTLAASTTTVMGLKDHNDHTAITPHHSALNYAVMARFAIQALYAPENLLERKAYFQRYPLESAHVAPLFLNQAVLAMPLASWQAGGFFVTAVQIKNLQTHALMIQPNMLDGEWLAVSFYPRQTVSSKNDTQGLDSTTLFLISSQPFSMALSHKGM